MLIIMMMTSEDNDTITLITITILENANDYPNK